MGFCFVYSEFFPSSQVCFFAFTRGVIVRFVTSSHLSINILKSILSPTPKLIWLNKGLGDQQLVQQEQSYLIGWLAYSTRLSKPRLFVLNASSRQRNRLLDLPSRIKKKVRMFGVIFQETRNGGVIQMLYRYGRRLNLSWRDLNQTISLSRERVPPSMLNLISTESKYNPKKILYIIKTKKTLCHFLFSQLKRRPFLLF